MNFSRLLCVTLALLLGAAPLWAQAPINQVETLRALPPSLVADGPAVALTGLVTYLRDTPEDFNFILDDGTGGVMVYPRQRQPLRLGQHASITGATRLDRPFVRVTAATLTVGEPGPLPAPLPATLEEIMAGRFEGRFVQIEELVRVVRLESAALRPRRLALDLGPRAGRLTAWISNYEGMETRFAPGARVRLSGVCVRWRNDRAQPLSTSLLINSPADVSELAQGAPPAAQPLAELLLWSNPPSTLRQTSGVVTLSTPGELIVLQEGERALRVRLAPADALTPGAAAPPPGTRVTASGFPVLGEYTAELEDARLSPMGADILPKPEPFTDAKALLAASGLVDRDARRVSLPATVRDVGIRDGRHAIELSSAGRPFTAWLPLEAALPTGLRAGADVRLTGICALHLDEERRRLGRPPGDFSLLLADANAIEILRPGPWWTARRLAGTLVLLVVSAAIGFFLAAWFGRKNAELRGEIDARRRAEYQLAGERRRMAADLHDTLQQTLLAAGLQLTAASRTLSAAPEAAATQLSLAHQLLARGEQEVRDAVWDLHAGDLETQQLDVLLARACEEAAARTPATVTYSIKGEARPLPPFLISQCLRLVRESVFNAIKHAAPRRIAVTLAFCPGSLHISIGDDGRGFDPAHAPGPDSGHFGLMGLRERVNRLGGTLEIQSTTAGTIIRALLPLP